MIRVKQLRREVRDLKDRSTGRSGKAQRGKRS